MSAPIRVLLRSVRGLEKSSLIWTPQMITLPFFDVNTVIKFVLNKMSNLLVVLEKYIHFLLFNDLFTIFNKIFLLQIWWELLKTFGFQEPKLWIVLFDLISYLFWLTGVAKWSKLTRNTDIAGYIPASTGQFSRSRFLSSWARGYKLTPLKIPTFTAFWEKKYLFYFVR